MAERGLFGIRRGTVIAGVCGCIHDTGSKVDGCFCIDHSIHRFPHLLTDQTTVLSLNAWAITKLLNSWTLFSLSPQNLS